MIMDYKEKVIALLKSQELSKEQKEKLEEMFPELKENEDERMLREIKRYIKEQGDKPTGLPNGTAAVADMIAWLEKQGEQKPADKIEPKFKVGDFIVNDYCMGRIVEITNDAYLLDTEQGIPFSCHSTRLWDITKDANDGDVLMSRAPFIYGRPIPYGGLDWYNGKFIKASNYVFKDSPVHPATKEQRNLLFSKMKEAGYVWDAEKKELKKIIDEKQIKKNLQDNSFRRMFEQKLAWSEEDDEMLDSIIEEVRYIGDFPDYPTKEENELYDECLAKVDWLKSLKDRCTWKPSDEQMKSLEEVIDAGHFTSYPNTLETLYEQLKKLKEE